MFVKKNIHFDLIIYGRRSNQTTDIINQVLSKNNGQFAEQIKVIEPTSWDHKLNKSAVFFISQVQNLFLLNSMTNLSSQFYNPVKFLVYCENLGRNHLEKIVKSQTLGIMEGHMSNYQYYLYEHKRNYELVSNEWFNPDYCQKPSYTVINSFNITSKKWKKIMKIPEKFRNFHECMLVTVAESNLMYTDLDVDGKPRGPLIDLFKAMGSRANFTYNYQIVKTNYNGTRSAVPNNFTVLTPQIHFQIAPFILSNYAPQNFHYTTLFHEQRISFALTESLPYSSFEKLSLPFDSMTWTCLVTIFFCAFLCIFILKFISKKIETLIYGKNVVSPALNVVGIFFGISQTKLPFRNFPRIILVTFILFCLVLRTAYQGVLFEMIAGDMRMPLPKTLDDLYEMDYRIFLCEAIYFTESLFPEKLKPRIEHVDMVTFTAHLIARKHNLEDKLAFCYYDNYLKMYDQYFPCSSGLLDEELYSSLGGIILPQFNFLYELADKTIQLLLANGIFQNSFEMQQFDVNLKLFTIAMDTSSVLAKIIPQQDPKPVVSKPINDLIDVMFVQKQIHFDLIIYGGMSYEGGDILDQFPKLTGMKYAEKIVLLPQSWDHIMSKSAILFFPHVSFFRKFSTKVKLESYYYNPVRFLIYCEQLEINDLLMVFKPPYLNMSPGNIALYQYFLIAKQNGFELVTFEWYTETVCNIAMIVPINFFNTNLMRWKNELKIYEKFRQFYGCMLTIGIVVGHMNVYTDASLNIVGPPIDLFKAMASVANFRYNHQLIKHGMNGAMVADPQLGRVIDIQIYLQVPRVAFSSITDYMHLTTVFYEEKVSFVLTEPEAYSSYEKLLLPFDTQTWIYSLTVFLCAFACIFVINLTSTKLQDLIYGENVSTPALNVIGIYFGSSQLKLPFKNFPRIILVTFIMFCLVLRTAYQGVLFEMIAGDMRKPLPKTIDDLYDMNYTISVGDDLEVSINETISIERRPNILVVDVLEQDNALMQNISNSALKIAYCSYSRVLRIYQNHFPSSGGFLKEDLYSYITGFMLLHFHFLYELTDETVQALVTGGILQHSFEMEDVSMNHGIYDIAKRYAVSAEKSKVLTVDDLSYGFTLWVFSCMITFVVFLFELTVFYLSFKDLMVLKLCKKLW